MAELAEQYQLKWIDFEAGASTIKQLPPEWRQNIDIVQIPDSRSFPVAADTALKLFNLRGPITICNKHGVVNCSMSTCKMDPDAFRINLSAMDNKKDILVLDSATQIASSIMTKIMKDRWDKDPEEMPEWKHYAHQGNLMSNIASAIQVANYNIVVISHEIQAETPDGKSKLGPVAGTRNFSATFAKFFDDVIYCELRAQAHRFGSSTTYALNVVSGSRADINISGLKKPSLIPFFDGTYLEKVAAVAVPTVPVKT